MHEVTVISLNVEWVARKRRAAFSASPPHAGAGDVTPIPSKRTASRENPHLDPVFILGVVGIVADHMPIVHIVGATNVSPEVVYNMPAETFIFRMSVELILWEDFFLYLNNVGVRIPTPLLGVSFLGQENVQVVLVHRKSSIIRVVWVRVIALFQHAASTGHIAGEEV